MAGENFSRLRLKKYMNSTDFYLAKAATQKISIYIFKKKRKIEAISVKKNLFLCDKIKAESRSFFVYFNFQHTFRYFLLLNKQYAFSLIYIILINISKLIIYTKIIIINRGKKLNKFHVARTNRSIFFVDQDQDF